MTVALASPHPAAKLYDPTAGASPVRILTHVHSIPLVLSDHPIVIELPS